jgi:Methyltransferase domain
VQALHPALSLRAPEQAGSLQMMSTTDTSGVSAAMQPPLPVYLDARATFAYSYLFGEGIEIGALHQPLAAPPHARVRYLDRMTTPDLRREYPELASWDLVDVDIVDDAEKLVTVPTGSQDFLIANHFLEHTEDPIGTIETHLSKLKPGGVLFYAIPDKRFTFDFLRPATPTEHNIADHEEGPERSRSEHFREWARLVMDDAWLEAGTAEQPPSEEWVEQRALQLEAQNYSIHMHVWTQAEFLQLIFALRDRADQGFDLEAAARVGIEFIVVLRKAGPLPAPAEPRGQLPFKEEARMLAKRAVRGAKREVQRRRKTP